MQSSNSNRRPSARQRGYDRRWDKARAAFLREPENRFCRMCLQQGRMAVATVVDHIVPHRGDPGLFWDRSNWQPLCKPHHDSAKQREERGRFVEIDGDGWPVERPEGGGSCSLGPIAPGPVGAPNFSVPRNSNRRSNR